LTSRFTALFLTLALALPGSSGIYPALSQGTLRPEAGLEETHPAVKQDFLRALGVVPQVRRISVGLEEKGKGRKPLGPGFYVRKAQQRYFHTDYSLALEAAREAIKLDPKSIGGHVELAKAFNALDLFSEAEGYAARAIELDPNSIGGHVELARARIGLRNYTGALEDATRAVEIDPKSMGGLLLRARSLSALRRYAAALTFAMAAVRIWPNFGGHLESARAFAGLRDYRAAERHVHLAIQIDPKNDKACALLAEILSYLGKFEKAKMASQTAASLEGNNKRHKEEQRERSGFAAGLEEAFFAKNSREFKLAAVLDLLHRSESYLAFKIVRTPGALTERRNGSLRMELVESFGVTQLEHLPEIVSRELLALSNLELRDLADDLIRAVDSGRSAFYREALLEILSWRKRQLTRQAHFLEDEVGTKSVMTSLVPVRSANGAVKFSTTVYFSGGNPWARFVQKWLGIYSRRNRRLETAPLAVPWDDMVARHKNIVQFLHLHPEASRENVISLLNVNGGLEENAQLRDALALGRLKEICSEVYSYLPDLQGSPAWRKVGIYLPTDNEKFLQQIYPHLGDFEVALDLGSGTLEWVLYVAAVRPRATVIGAEYDLWHIERSKEALRMAREEGLIGPDQKIEILAGDFLHNEEIKSWVRRAELIHYFQAGTIDEKGLQDLIAENVRPGARFFVQRITGARFGPIFPALIGRGFQYERAAPLLEIYTRLGGLEEGRAPLRAGSPSRQSQPVRRKARTAAEDTLIKVLFEQVLPRLKPEALVGIGPSAAQRYQEDLALLAAYAPFEIKQRLFVWTGESDFGRRFAWQLEQRGIMAGADVDLFAKRVAGFDGPRVAEFYGKSEELAQFQAALKAHGWNRTRLEGRPVPRELEDLLRQVLASLTNTGLEEIDQVINVRGLAGALNTLMQA